MVSDEEEKNKGSEKIFEKVMVKKKLTQYGKENSQSSPRSAESSIQDKCKEKHVKTHTNQTNK